jgi:hypothetical protein
LQPRENSKAKLNIHVPRCTLIKPPVLTVIIRIRTEPATHKSTGPCD